MQRIKPPSRLVIAERGGRVLQFDGRDGTALAVDTSLCERIERGAVNDAHGLLAAAAHPDYDDDTSPYTRTLYALYATSRTRHHAGAPDDAPTHVPPHVGRRAPSQRLLLCVACLRAGAAPRLVAAFEIRARRVRAELAFGARELDAHNLYVLAVPRDGAAHGLLTALACDGTVPRKFRCDAVGTPMSARVTSRARRLVADELGVRYDDVDAVDGTWRRMQVPLFAAAWPVEPHVVANADATDDTAWRVECADGATA